MASYTAQGYYGETLLMAPITPPENFTTQSVHLAAKVSWMCCEKTCHPAMGVPFSIDLPVTDMALPDRSTQPLFEKFRALVARPDPSWQATVKREQNHVMLTLKSRVPQTMMIDAHDIKFFTLDGQIDSNGKQQVRLLASSEIQMELPLSEHTSIQPTLPGVVIFPAGWCGNAQPLRLRIEPRY
jgi:DsbC/DsbD-like thiol-disulfide interchange protein